MKGVFFKGQKKLIIKTIKTVVINKQITVKKIITCIKLIGELSNYGFNIEGFLREELSKNVFFCQKITQESKS